MYVLHSSVSVFPLYILSSADFNNAIRKSVHSGPGRSALTCVSVAYKYVCEGGGRQDEGQVEGEGEQQGCGRLPRS